MILWFSQSHLPVITSQRHTVTITINLNNRGFLIISVLPLLILFSSMDFQIKLYNGIVEV